MTDIKGRKSQPIRMQEAMKSARKNHRMILGVGLPSIVLPNHRLPLWPAAQSPIQQENLPVQAFLELPSVVRDKLIAWGNTIGVTQNGMIDASSAENRTGHRQEQNLVYDHRVIAAENGVGNAAADNGRHTEKYQDAQLPAHIHT